MARLNESKSMTEQPLTEGLFSEEDRLGIVADLMFEIIVEQLAEEDVECTTS